MAEEIRFAGDVQRLRPAPGDRFVLRCKRELAPAEVEHVLATWREVIGEDVPLIVLGPGMELETVNMLEVVSKVD